MIEASRRAAEEMLVDQTLIRVEQSTFDAFIAALDAPLAPNAALRKTMTTPAPWDKM
jgi:uncharacterized protein (DUF1778 family)